MLAMVASVRSKNRLFRPIDIMVDQFGRGCQLLGQCLILLLATLRYIVKGEIDWPETWRQSYKIGVESCIVVSLTALFTGFAMSLQISRELVLFGADTAIGGVVSLALVREIGPITAGIMVAGRVGSSVAAELTTMMITEQIDALKVMRVDPIQFLVVPRFVAAMLMMPALTVYAMALGLVAGIFIAYTAANVPPATFLDSVKQTILDRDFGTHFLKAWVNAILIIVISCAIGLRTRGGAEDVGIATTRTIVWTMTMLFVCNYIITAVTYAPR